MNKEWYRAKIREIADTNGGRPPGAKQFYSATNTKESLWRNKTWNDWNSWGDAREEFGFERGEFITAYERTEILEHLAEYIQALSPPRYPTLNDLRRAKRRGFDIPSDGTIRRQIGEKDAVIRSLVEFCDDREQYEQALQVCKKIAPDEIGMSDGIAADSSDNPTNFGWVYLIRAQGAYKIGCSRAPYRRAAEIANQSAKGAELLHKIETEDPEGIEDYWHRRFSTKRLDGLNKRSGEWFDLSSEDVRAFKKRKSM